MKYAYHVTQEINLNSIAEKGLILHKSAPWPDRVWFTDTEYGYPPMKHCNGALLRFPWPDNATYFTGPSDCGDPAEYYVKNNIPISQLEILIKIPRDYKFSYEENDNWVSITEYQNKEKYTLFQYENIEQYNMFISQPKFVKFGQKYKFLSSIPLCMNLWDARKWVSVINGTSTKDIWETFIPLNYEFKTGTEVIFTRWVLNGKNGLPFHHESIYKQEDFLVFKLVNDPTETEFFTNLKDYDQFELI